ncbi:MAG: NAD(P)/FAD-dependent oxidoreductase [Sphingorhabdus sp.]
MDRIDTVVIGAGVIGLAVARALAMAGRDVVIIESETQFGSITSSRNSEVIHAGIYYPQGSVKAQTCTSGRALLYDYCATHNVAHRRCGKLIVATNDAEAVGLETIRTAAHANGLEDVDWIDARAIEPDLRCVAALTSPSTGIIDAHGYMLALLGDAEDAGAMLAYGTRILSGARTSDGIRLVTSAGEIEATLVVNAAGLEAPALASCIDGLSPQFIPESWLAKGNYFTLSGKNPFSHLIYPVPVDGGLGVHLTLDLAGQARFGPDVEWIDEIDYAVNPARGDVFYEAIRRYWPSLPDGALVPGYAGIRPKISGPGTPAADFRIEGSETHGVDGLINLFGIESPGLTASLAIAEQVRTLAEAMR